MSDDSSGNSPPRVWVYGEETQIRQERWRRQEIAAIQPKSTSFDYLEVEAQRERWKRSADLDPNTTTEEHQFLVKMSHANNLQHRGGMDFYALARGTERNYSTSFLINLDPDLLSLCGTSAFDLTEEAIVGHTKRIFQTIRTKSRRDISQFCFGSTHVQLNPNYRKFDRMDPLTWKKEGIASQWAGIRGLRKTCCKVCCIDMMCQGCRKCNGCMNGPIRGNYDGMVVLCVVTKECLPNMTIAPTTFLNKRKEERHLDHENYSVALETALTTHFMYGNEMEYIMKCVPTSRMAIMSGDAMQEDFTRKLKKFVGYVIYVGYRLDVPGSYAPLGPQPALKATRANSNSQLGPVAIPEEGPSREKEELEYGKSRDSSAMFPDFNVGRHEEDLDELEYRSVDDYGHDVDYKNDDAEEDEKLLEELEDKQLLARIASIETENQNLKEQIWKLEHGRNWLENRLTALEMDVAALKAGPKSN